MDEFKGTRNGFTLMVNTGNNSYDVANECTADINGDVLTVGRYSGGAFAYPSDTNIDELLII